MSQKNILIVVIVVLIIVAGGLLAWYFMQDEEVTSTNTVTNTNSNATLNTAGEKPAKNVVWIIDGSFNPSVVTINTGDTVTWVNKDEISRQVASDPYPSNSALPNLESEPLEINDEYSYTFDETGTWFYHDNLNPINKGTVIVE